MLFFDGDQAGRQAVEKLSRRLQALRPEVVISVVQTLDDEDVNSLIVTYDADCIKTLIQERLPLCEANQAASSTEVIISENGKQGPRSALGLDTSDEAFPRFVAPEVVITVMGGIKLMGLDRLRVSLKLERADGQGYPLRHNLDLYLVGKVDSLVERAASELDLSTATLRRIVAELTDQLERYRLRKIEALNPRQEKPTLTKTQYDEARAYLS